MRDLSYQLQLIPGLARLFTMNDAASNVGVMNDIGPLKKNASHKGYSNSPFGANAQQPSHLLNQCRKKYSYCYGAGHVANGGDAGVHDEYLLNTVAGDNPTAASWSMVFAGLKLHNMSVLRFWHSIYQNQGAGVAIDTDGTLVLQPGPGSAWAIRSAPGALKRFVPQMLIVSYDHSSHSISAYVGDWSGNFATVINAAGGADLAIAANTTARLGDAFGSNGALTMNAADGFLDIFAFYAGHAITAAEARALWIEAGYNDGGVTYPRSLSHRNSVINQVKAPGATLDATSAAAASEYANNQIIPGKAQGAGGFNTDANAIAIYHVTKAYRDSLPTVGMVVGYSGYSTYFPGYMLNEDCPLPYGGQPSLGFLPSGLASDGSWSGSLRADWQTNTGSAPPSTVWNSQGSDHTFCVMCDDTDEYWEGYQIHNTNAPVPGNPQSSVGLPVWSTQYGQKQSQFSLQWGGGRDNMIGCRATGIPVILGTPTIADLQAIAAGTKSDLTYAVTGNCQNAKSGAHKWPALRDDGTLTTSSVVEGMIFRFKQDAATTARIAAMHYSMGRAWARAIQKYGHIPNDKTAFWMIMQAQSPEEYKILNGGIEPYYQGTNPIDQGAQYTEFLMDDAPWDALEVVSSDALNPMWASQPIRPAPKGIGGSRSPQAILLSWTDDPLVGYWNVYQTVGAVDTLIATTEFPSYVVNNPKGGMTFKVSAVNGGGESVKSAAFTPPPPLRSRRRVRLSLG